MADGKVAWRTRPWSFQLAPGVFATPRREVWLYMAFPLAPLEWEDPPRRLEHQSKIERFLIELGESSRDLAGGVKTLSQNRNIHIVTVLYDRVNSVNADLPLKLAEFQRRVMFDTAPKKVLAVGVKLRRDALGALTNTESEESMVKRAFKAVRASAETPSDLSLFAKDYERIKGLFARSGARELTVEEIAQITSWFNNGNGLDTVVSASAMKLRTSDNTTWQISTLMGVDEQAMQMKSPDSTWIMDAMNHADGANAISIRAELEPPTVTRGRLRRSQRSLRNQEEEEAATGDVEREELGERRSMAKVIENYTRSAGHAWLTKTSVLFARRLQDREPDETYADMLRTYYGMDIKPLEKRQLKALSEMLPGSEERVNPFGQDVNPAWIGYSGMNGFGDIGDESGLILGSADPHWTNVFIDPYGASNNNLSPIMGIFGSPGSGKTFAAQLLVAQAALAGEAAIFINPKGNDSLKEFAAWVGRAGAQSRVVSMLKMEEEGGAFDPFRFMEPKMAAETLTRHILTVLGILYDGGLTGRQETELGRGLAEGAAMGAMCAMEALQYVRDPDIIEQVTSMVEASTLFGLAFGKVPREPWEAGSGLTLIEFDRAMALPPPGKEKLEREERIAISALRLVSRASLEILMRSRGGVLVVDEAHHFLGSPEGLATLDRIGREGRSLGILPIFATQRVTDLLKVDMESFMSRVLTMRLADKKEAAAALELCGLEATESRLSFLSASGPGLGFFRDLSNRHSVIQVGAGVPEDLRMAMSTNRADRIAREKAAGEDQ